MNIHVCKQCGSQFVYCRACVFRPIRYKDNGFCSKECYEASKNVVEPIIEKVMPMEITLVEDIMEETTPAEVVETLSIEEVEVEAIAPIETPTEETTVEETTIKNETNTYKKKKNKYPVHE